MRSGSIRSWPRWRGDHCPSHPGTGQAVEPVQGTHPRERTAYCPSVRLEFLSEPRARRFVRMKNTLLVMSTLLRTKKKSAVHFKLDLYIILLSGMRFLSDKDRIQNGIADLLSRNRAKTGGQLNLVFMMVIKKTNNRQDICLYLKLVRLLL